MNKTPIYNDELPNLFFPWALKVSNIKDLLFVSGHADVKLDNSSVNFPNDLIGQTKFILKQISKSIDKAGFSIKDVVRMEVTLTKNVTDEQLPELFGLLEDYLKDSPVKPAGGTLRFIDRLIGKECLIEIEFILAQ